jgi:hypothetical protein
MTRIVAALAWWQSCFSDGLVRLLNQELFEEFCEEFTREMKRLRMEHRASITSARPEVARIGTRIKKLLNLMFPLLGDLFASKRAAGST